MTTSPDVVAKVSVIFIYILQVNLGGLKAGGQGGSLPPSIGRNVSERSLLVNVHFNTVSILCSILILYCV